MEPLLRMNNKRQSAARPGQAPRVFAALLCIGLLPCVSFASGDPERTCEAQALGIRFSYPAGFVVGSFDTTHDLTGHFRRQIVLVDPAELNGLPRTAIPVGDIPTISIGVETGTQAEFLARFMDIDIVRKFFSAEVAESEFRRTIGAHTAYRLPGYPGPYGDALFYYLVPLADGRCVELSAHKYYFRKPKGGASGGYPETHYDRIIERVIETLLSCTVHADSIRAGFSVNAGQWIEPLDQFSSSDQGDIDIDQSMQDGKVLVVRFDLDGDSIPEYFVRTLCGNGGCEYPVFDGRTERFLGSVFGSEIWVLHQSMGGMPVIEAFGHLSAGEGIIGSYHFNGAGYKRVSTRTVSSGEETEAMYKELHRAPRIN